MCDETIFRILNAHYPNLKISFNFDRKGLNRALSVKASPCTTQNPHGLYVAKFQTECPYFGNKREVSYYFRQVTNDTQPPHDPQCALDVFDKHATSNQLQRNCIRLGNNMREDVLVDLRERVKILADVLQSCEGYKRVIDHSEEWPLSPKQICYLRNKCLYLCTAYTIALDKMGKKGITWVNTCCQEAVDLLGGLGFITTTDQKRISYWNIHFRKGKQFSSSKPLRCQWNQSKTSIV